MSAPLNADNTFGKIEAEKKAKAKAKSEENGVSEGKGGDGTPEKKKKKEKLKPGEVIRGELDFAEVAKDVGYLKARQMLKQAAVAVHQNSITKVDDSLQDSKKPARLKEAIRLSNTLGAPSSVSVQVSFKV